VVDIQGAMGTYLIIFFTPLLYQGPGILKSSEHLPVQKLDLTPENGTSYNLLKGEIHGQEMVHTVTDHQQAKGSGNTA